MMTFTEQNYLDKIKPIWNELKMIFTHHLDQNWFSGIIDDLPFDSCSMKLIRDAFTYENISNIHIIDFCQAVLGIESFIHHIRKYLLPVLREKLGISMLHPKTTVMDRDRYILRSLFAYTLPYNLDRMHNLTSKLLEFIAENKIQSA